MIPSLCSYFFSWRDPTLAGAEKDWLDARNFCRQRCMDSVSVETSPENEWIKQKIVDGKVSVLLEFLLFAVFGNAASRRCVGDHDHD